MRGFSDYKLLIHAATDNPFLLYIDYLAIDTSCCFDSLTKRGSLEFDSPRNVLTSVALANDKMSLC